MANNKDSKLTFSTTLLQAKKTATGIEVPANVIEELGAGKKPAVKVTINGYTYRSSIAVMGGVFMIGVSAAVREQAGVNAGDEVNIKLELDTEVREVTLHPDFEAALKKEPDAKKHFDTLSYSKKQLHTLPIGEAKTDETRQRRIEKAIGTLKEGK